MTKIKEYAKEIPEEIRRAIRGLASDYRAAIFVALHKHGELPFSELQKALEIDKAKLNYHLGKLIEGALVHHYYKHELGTEKYSFYNITPFGQNFVEILSQFLRPQPSPILFEDVSAASKAFINFEDIVPFGNLMSQPIIPRGCMHALKGLIDCNELLIVLDADTLRGQLVFPTLAEEGTNIRKMSIQTPTV